MSWTAILVLSAGAYLFKLVGLVAGDRLAVRLAPVASLLPAALFAAIIAVMSVVHGESLVVDGRLVGVDRGLAAPRPGVLTSAHAETPSGTPVPLGPEGSGSASAASSSR